MTQRQFIREVNPTESAGFRSSDLDAAAIQPYMFVTSWEITQIVSVHVTVATAPSKWTKCRVLSVARQRGKCD